MPAREGLRARPNGTRARTSNRSVAHASARRATGGGTVQSLPDVDASPDPDDNPILATAIAGRADLIVSGDKKHMLALGHISDIPIVTAVAALELVARRDFPTGDEP